MKTSSIDFFKAVVEKNGKLSVEDTLKGIELENFNINAYPTDGGDGSYSQIVITNYVEKDSAETLSTRDWPVFDLLFGREAWQGFIAKLDKEFIEDDEDLFE